jgi:hypothetical protein
MNERIYPFLLTIDGKPQRYDIEASSVTEAAFLMGVTFGQENPDDDMHTAEISIRKLWGNP